MIAPLALLLLVTSDAGPQIPAARTSTAVSVPVERPELPPYVARSPSLGEVSVLSGAFGLALSQVIVGPWRDGFRREFLMDGAVRDALRLGSESWRRRGRDLSDMTLVSLWSYALVFDPVYLAYHREDRPALAAHLLWMNAMTLSVVTAIHTTTRAIVSRERPFVELCGGLYPSTSQFCRGNERNFSFFSGHTAHAFAAATLTCQHHRYLGSFLGGPATSPWTCAAGLATAGLTGLLRIAGDAHYASDVLVGAAVGSSAGLLVPWLLRYRHHASSETTRWTLVPTGHGLQLVGWWP